MTLTEYLRQTGELPSAFARRIGIYHSTLSTWLNVPGRGPGRVSLAKIEQATGGLVTAKDFSPREASIAPAPATNTTVSGQCV